MKMVHIRSMIIASAAASAITFLLYSCAGSSSSPSLLNRSSVAEQGGGTHSFTFPDFGAPSEEPSAVIDRMSHVEPGLLPRLKQRIRHAHSIPILYRDAPLAEASGSQLDSDEWKIKAICSVFYFETSPQGPELDLSSEAFSRTIITSSQLYALYTGDLDVTIEDLLGSAFVPFSGVFTEQDTSLRIPGSTSHFIGEADLAQIGSDNWLFSARRSILNTLKLEFAELSDAVRTGVRSSKIAFPNGALPEFWQMIGEDAEDSIGSLVNNDQSWKPCNCGKNHKKTPEITRNLSTEMCCFVKMNTIFLPPGANHQKKWCCKCEGSSQEHCCYVNWTSSGGTLYTYMEDIKYAPCAAHFEGYHKHHHGQHWASSYQYSTGSTLTWKQVYCDIPTCLDIDYECMNDAGQSAQDFYDGLGNIGDTLPGGLTPVQVHTCDAGILV